MVIKKSEDIRSSEITPKSWYLNRRKFLAGVAAAGAAAAAGAYGVRGLVAPSSSASANTKLDGIQKSPFSTTETITPYKDVTNYNNYYEFSTDKYEPANLAKNFKTRPWTVEIDGAVNTKQKFDVVRITFTERQPINTWNESNPQEYGFYSNVNPNVDHPRWSQAKERRLGEFTKRPTLMFNGYGDQVASLYSGMDLKKNF